MHLITTLHHYATRHLPTLLVLLTLFFYSSLVSSQESKPFTDSDLARETALRDSLTASGRFPEAVALSNRLCEGLLSGGRYHDALEILASSSEAYWRRGQTVAADSVLNSVETKAKKLLENPSAVYPTLYRNRGAIHIYKREYNLAIADLKKSSYYFDQHDTNDGATRSKAIRSIGACFLSGRF